MSVGANTRFLKLGMIQNLEYPALPLPEQKRIVKELDTLSEKTKALQNIYEQMLLDCEELKQSFLCKAFAGEL
jgi:type I restriction enzyme S subunit